MGKTQFQFRKAERRKLLVRTAIMGPSGSGKTLGALRLATGIASKIEGGGRIAMIDTENGSAEHYASDFTFETLDLTPPFTPERYIEAMEAAEEAGYHVLIVDSTSHEWMGPGGILDTLDKMSDSNQFAKWRVLTPRHNKFVDKQLRSKIHLIATLRGKDEYVLEVNEHGKQVPKKVGVGAQQRSGLEYEYTIVFEVGMGHYASTTKDRTGLFVHFHDHLTEQTGVQLMEWADSGEEAIERTTSSVLDGNGNGNGGMDENQIAYRGARQEFIGQIAKVLDSKGADGQPLFDGHDKDRARADVDATKGKELSELEKVVQYLVAEQGVRMSPPVAADGDPPAKNEEEEPAEAVPTDFDDDIPWGDDNKSGDEKADGQAELLPSSGDEPEPEEGPPAASDSATSDEVEKQEAPKRTTKQQGRDPEGSERGALPGEAPPPRLEELRERVSRAQANAPGWLGIGGPSGSGKQEATK